MILVIICAMKLLRGHPSDVDGEELPNRTAANADAKVIAAEEIFEGRREILIRHAGGLYRLRITQSDKLILTK